MKLTAYVLAADPAWIERSVLSYYDIVERIVVSYDMHSRAWTGAPIDVEECLRRLRAIDRHGKFDFQPGHFAREEFFGQPMTSETHQRQTALAHASKGADWILQIDTDEVLPKASRLLEILKQPWTNTVDAIEWPMRVLFRHLSGSNYLEVCGPHGEDRYEYPGPIVVRPGVTLEHARRISGAFTRLTCKGDTASFQLQQPVDELENRLELLVHDEAIIHNSWGRSPRDVRSKIRSWGHYSGIRSWWFYYRYWLPAPYVWRSINNFHPFHRPLWPALKPIELRKAGI